MVAEEVVEISRVSVVDEELGCEVGKSHHKVLLGEVPVGAD